MAAVLIWTVIGLVAGPLARAQSTGPGSALTFNGVNQYSIVDRPVSTEFTIEFWMKSTMVAGTDGQWWNGAGLVDAEVGGFANDFGVSLGAGKVLFGVGNPNGNDVTIRSGVVADGTWHHVAATRHAFGAMNLYIDGFGVSSNFANSASLTAPGRPPSGQQPCCSDSTSEISLMDLRRATPPDCLFHEIPPGGRSFVMGHCHGRHSPLQGCPARSASPKT